ncbi:DUF1772 domain-containing protein [Luteimicrobium subarcticum]|uniref:Uncharacterized protein DUF1772 n=1 Tax=Luteimicrobium subarcticum TaxID=620910 RepID=A0A2M8WJ38_9MICO|nr:DUF1772 domain-containing protein [Luteimicrobium subarcticum]PJI90945.1 uncharacterized protein DUF1772 [Luteimicrobium subarcticum]
MNATSHLLALFAVLGVGMIYGTDALGALVMSPAWKKVDDRTLVSANGWMHYFGDRRFPLPGVLGLVLTVLAGAAAAVSGRGGALACAAVATLVLVAWLVVYKTVNAPINKVLIAAAQVGEVPDDARALQTRWESVLTLRVVLQGVAVAALCGVLSLP